MNDLKKYIVIGKFEMFDRVFLEKDVIYIAKGFYRYGVRDQLTHYESTRSEYSKIFDTNKSYLGLMLCSDIDYKKITETP